MGRNNGTWSPLYGQAWDHPKTAAAAAHVVANGRGIPEECAPSVVLGWLNRICIWCLNNGETGSTRALTAGRLATIAWPEGLAAGRNVLRTGELIRGALRAGGFLEDGLDGERVHDFGDHHARILKERQRKREAKDAEDSADHSAERSADQGAEHSAERRAEHSAPTDNDTDNVPTTTTTTVPTGPPTPAKPGALGGGRAKAPPSPTEAAARALSTALGSGLNPCRKAVASLVAAGWDVDRIRRAITEHAQPGDAPWDWAKSARGARSASQPTGAAAVADWLRNRKDIA